MPEHVKAELVAAITDLVADATYAFVHARVIEVLAALDEEALATLVASAEERRRSKLQLQTHYGSGTC